MIMDFSELKSIVESRVLQQLDHSYINDFVKTAFCRKISPGGYGINFIMNSAGKTVSFTEVEVWETENCGVSYRGE